MKKDNKNKKPYSIRLPGFLFENEIGLGDIIKRVTSSIGVKPCGSCEQRAAMLNKWVVFHSKNQINNQL